MELVFATDPGDGGVNEDAVVAGDGYAAVLDGATAEPDTDSGCVHGVRWYTRRLAGALADRLTRDTGPLTVLLYDAIAAVAASHAGTCDLDNPCSPNATVAVLRHRDSQVDYLVLGDSPIVLGHRDGTATPVIDDRLARYTGTWTDMRYSRNVAGGFWVAGTNAEAAWQAVHGTVTAPSRAGLVTDGVTRLVERHGWTWARLLDGLDKVGPGEVIAGLREVERRGGDRFIGKRHDDATAALCRFAAV